MRTEGRERGWMKGKGEKREVGWGEKNEKRNKR